MTTVSPLVPNQHMTSPYADAQEPRLDDLYADPLLQAVLKRDGVNLSTLKEVVKNAQERLAA
jgi:hypothetical protein